MQSIHSNPTQCEMILSYLSEFGTITQLDAMIDLGIMRLASRISELKRRGYKLQKSTRVAKNRYNKPTRFAEYSLIK